jgi:hypothetical protein
MIDHLATLSFHGVNGLPETIATITAVLVLHLLATR